MTRASDAKDAPGVTARQLDDRGDEELMAMVANGHKEALGILYRRYGALVGSVLCRLLPATALHEAHDLRQEVFIALYQNARRYQPRGLFRAYLLGIAARQVRGLTRGMAIHRRLLALFWGTSTRRSEPAERPEAALDARLMISRLLSRLSAAHREVVILFHLQGLSAAEISCCLAISEKTVWTRLHRARRALQKARGTEPGEAT